MYIIFSPGTTGDKFCPLLDLILIANFDKSVLNNLRLNVACCSDTKSFVIRFEYFGRSIFDHLKSFVATTLPQRTTLPALDEEQAVQAVVATTFPPLGNVLLAHCAIAIHPARLFVVSSVGKGKNVYSKQLLLIREYQHYPNVRIVLFLQ